MKQKIVPTSPKSPDRSHAEDTSLLTHRRFPRRHFFFLLGAIGVGTLAGFFGVVIASTLPAQWPVLGQFNIIALFQQERERVLLPLTRVAQQPLTADTLRLFEETVALYDAPPTLDGTEQFLGNAAIVSSDGWLVAMSAPFLLRDELGKEQSRLPVVLTSQGAVLTVGKTVSDPASGITFFQIDVANLNPVAFLDSALLVIGQSVFVVEERLGTLIVSERSTAGMRERSHAIQSTDVLRAMMTLNQAEGLTPSAPLFSSNGYFLGLLDREGTVVSADVIRGNLADILRTGAIQPLNAQFEYINVARVTEEEKKRRNLPDHGILIINAHVAENDTPTLQVDDVIVRINHRPVDGDTDLASVFHAASFDAPLLLDVLRGGEEIAIAVAL